MHSAPYLAEPDLVNRVESIYTLAMLVGKHHMQMRFDRITVNPEIMNGQPCIRGMRLTVRRVVEAVALYPNRDELKAEYPELEDEDVRQALEFAAQNLDDQIIPVEAA